MIVSGTRNAVIEAVRPLDIHGTIYYDLVYTHDDEAQPRQARLGAESLYSEIAPGDRVLVRYLMNVATTIERRSGSS
jgi:hypothetical protein